MPQLHQPLLAGGRGALAAPQPPRGQEGPNTLCPDLGPWMLPGKQKYEVISLHESTELCRDIASFDKQALFHKK